MKKNQSGQALLLVLLSIGVLITIALSVVSRSITDVSTTSKDEQSLRAFSAAEAGIEQILATPIAELGLGGPSGSIETGQVGSFAGGQTTFTATFTSYPQNVREFVYPTELSSGDTATVWLATHASDNSLTCNGSVPCYTGSNIRMCWGKTGVSAGSQPAIVVAVMYQDTTAGNPLKFAYATYDPSGSRRATNKFDGAAFTAIATNTTDGAANFGGMKFANCATLNLGAGGLGLPAGVISGRRLMAATTMLLYNNQPTIFGVTQLPADLPVQGRIIESSGIAGESTRKVQVYAVYPEVPSMFQAAIFSPPGVTQ